MSRTAAVTIPWGDGEYTFRLGIGERRDLQEKTGVGLLSLHRRLIDGGWRNEDAREVLRCGLIGGGLAPTAAHELVKVWSDQRPLMESIVPAALVVQAALYGGPDAEPVGKEAAPTAATETTAPTSPPSTAPPP
jgi:hypothetical protein